MRHTVPYSAVPCALRGEGLRSRAVGDSYEITKTIFLGKKSFYFIFFIYFQKHRMKTCQHNLNVCLLLIVIRITVKDIAWY